MQRRVVFGRMPFDAGPAGRTILLASSILTLLATGWPAAADPAPAAAMAGSTTTGGAAPASSGPTAGDGKGRGEAGQAATVLLIGNSRVGALPPLPNCIPALKDLGNRLRNRGDDVLLLADAAAPTLRAGIGRFAASLPPAGRAVVAFCGYAMADGDKLFLLPADASVSQPAHLAREAVIARVLARVLARHDAILVAELHAPPGAASLDPAIHSLQEQTAPSTQISIRTVTDTKAAPQINAFSKQVAGAGSWGALTRAMARSSAAAPSQAALSPPPVLPAPPGPGSPDVKPPEPAVTAFAAGPAPATDASGVATPAKPVTPHRARPAYGHGTGSVAIRRIQVGLIARGLFKGRVTGMIDAETQSAIRAFQKLQGDKQTGFLTFSQTQSLE